jgi:hypothetical protein
MGDFRLNLVCILRIAGLVILSHLTRATVVLWQEVSNYGRVDQIYYIWFSISAFSDRVGYNQETTDLVPSLQDPAESLVLDAPKSGRVSDEV